MDNVSTYADNSSDPVVLAHYSKQLLIKKQHSTGKELKFGGFYSFMKYEVVNSFYDSSMFIKYFTLTLYGRISNEIS